VLSGLTVNVERMRENLHRSAGAICSEAVMIRLGRLIDPANHLGHAARLVDDVLSAG
jgi:adenylosuccinate lyase